MYRSSGSRPGTPKVAAAEVLLVPGGTLLPLAAESDLGRLRSTPVPEGLKGSWEHRSQAAWQGRTEGDSCGQGISASGHSFFFQVRKLPELNQGHLHLTRHGGVSGPRRQHCTRPQWRHAALGGKGL